MATLSSTLVWKIPWTEEPGGLQSMGSPRVAHNWATSLLAEEMAGWHHRLSGHGFGWTPGVGDGQGGLACCGLWGCRVRHDWAPELSWTEEVSKAHILRFSLVAQSVKNLPAVQEMEVQSLVRKIPWKINGNPLSSILALEIPWTKDLSYSGWVSKSQARLSN